MSRNVPIFQYPRPRADPSYADRAEGAIVEMTLVPIGTGS